LASNNYNSFKYNLKISKIDERFVPAIGIHPLYLKNNLKDLIKITDMIKNIQILGEIGLDHYFIRDKFEWTLQEKVFRTFLYLAQRYNLKLIIHSKGAESEVIEILDNYKIKQVIFHWFSGSMKELKKILDKNYFISISPALIYSKKIQKYIELINVENILTESDAPFGVKNLKFNPNMIIKVVKLISQIKSINLNYIKSAIYENLMRFLQSS
jgi:TatD DNase family protein